MAKAGKVGIRQRDEFVNGTEYDKLDLVSYNNKIYLSKKPSTGILPTDTEYWSLLIDLDGKLDTDGDSKDNTVTFTSDDAESADAWTEVAVMASGEKHSSLLKKISAMFKNVRFLKTELGNKAASKHTHDASDIETGTLDAARIPSLDAGKITSGTLGAERIPTIAASKVTSGAFASTDVKAKSGTDYTTARVRNIQAGTTDLTAGTSELASGDIYVMYE